MLWVKNQTRFILLTFAKNQPLRWDFQLISTRSANSMLLHPSNRDFELRTSVLNPLKGKGITLEGFTISIHQHYIKEKGGMLRNNQ